jgi:hypothetical protein
MREVNNLFAGQLFIIMARATKELVIRDFSTMIFKYPTTFFIFEICSLNFIQLFIFIVDITV